MVAGAEGARGMSEEWRERALAAEAALAKAQPAIDAANAILQAARPVLLNLIRLDDLASENSLSK